MAQQYAAAIDNSAEPEKALAELGPKLLVTLTALGATPAAQAAVLKGGDRGTPRLELLRATRRAQAQRLRYPAITFTARRCSA